LQLLNNRARAGIVDAMRQVLACGLLAFALALTAQAGAAACYADYKAKRDNPLRLHYGVMELRGQCSRSAARSEVAGRLQRAGWTLLNVVSVFDDSGLRSRRGSAGQYFLRF
jgi:hypothetical protein